MTLFRIFEFKLGLGKFEIGFGEFGLELGKLSLGNDVFHRLGLSGHQVCFSFGAPHYQVSTPAEASPYPHEIGY